jgi:hypothetical protein
MPQHCTRSNGTIDYDAYRKEAGRLRREAHRRLVMGIAGLVVAAVRLPFTAMKRFVGAWQSAWPSPAAREERRLHAGSFVRLARIRTMFW